MAHSILLAKLYNNATGSNITHREVESWGFVEAIEIEYALDYIDTLG